MDVVHPSVMLIIDGLFFFFNLENHLATKIIGTMQRVCTKYKTILWIDSSNVGLHYLFISKIFLALVRGVLCDSVREC